MFSQTAEYAVRAVVWLAEHAEEGATGSRRIAEDTQVPPTYLAKVLHALAKAGIVTSRRGVGGGFVLAYAPAELTVLDVVHAVEPPKRIVSCPLKLKTHRKTLCPMHAHIDEALVKFEDALAGWTIAQILYEPSRPKPMIETRA